MKKRRIPAILFLPMLLIPFFSSCAGRVSGALLADGQADLNVYASLEPRMTMLIGALALASGTAQQGAPLLNGPAISASMADAPGVESASFRNLSPAAIEGPVKISRLSDFLASGKSSGFISFEQGGASKNGRCSIDLDLESGPQILDLISHEIGAYLSALMAPLATGEILTKTEYLMLVSSVYGRGISDEIAQAAIHAAVDFPGQVQSAKGGTFSGRRAEFQIPLLDLLVLETPLSYEVTWR